MSRSAAERLNVFTLHNVQRESVKKFCTSKKKGPFHFPKPPKKDAMIKMKDKNEPKYSKLLRPPPATPPSPN